MTTATSFAMPLRIPTHELRTQVVRAAKHSTTDIVCLRNGILYRRI
jgi:hypothetical protein